MLCFNNNKDNKFSTIIPIPTRIAGLVDINKQWVFEVSYGDSIPNLGTF